MSDDRLAPFRRTGGGFRPSKGEAFLRIAEILAELSTCPDGARHGGVIAVDNRIVATGYGYPPAGVDPCERCWLREKFAETGVKDFSVCPAHHAEHNALIYARRAGVSVVGGVAYLTKAPCADCRRGLVEAGIARVVTPEGEVALT